MSLPSRRLPAPGLALVAVLVFHGAVLGTGVFFQRDIHWVWYPRVESMVRAVAGGAWPLWDPHPAFGAPALADPSYQIAYPPSWLNLALRPALYYTVFALAHLTLAGLGLHLLARRWGLQPLPAFVAGAAWMASGPVLSSVSLFHHFAGLAWIPWVLLALEGALTRGTLGSAWLLGVAGAAQLLAGSGDMCLMTGMAGVARVAVWVWSRWGSRGAALGALCRAALLAGVSGLSLAAVQWLPTAILLAGGSRVKVDVAANMSWSLHPASLLELAVPGLLAEAPISAAARAALFESREPFLPSVYLGVGGLALAGLGVLLGRGRVRSGALAASLLFLLCALGRHTPLYPLLLGIPPFSMLRYPVKYTIPMSLFVSLLAGLGMEAWGRSWAGGERRRAILVASGCLVAGALALGLAEWTRSSPGALQGWLDRAAAPFPLEVHKLRVAAGLAGACALLLAWRARRAPPDGAATAALILLTLGDLVLAGGRVNRLAPPELAAHRPAVLATLGAGPHRLRVMPVSRAARQGFERTREGWVPEWSWTLGIEELMAPPIGGRWGVDGSYDGDFTGLAPPALSALTRLLGQAGATPLGLRLLQIGSVDHVVSLEEEPWLGPESARINSTFPLPIRVYPVPDPLPRVYLVDGFRGAHEPASYALLQDPGFDPRREVILAADGARPPGPGFTGTVRVLRRRADALTVEAQSSGPAYLVVVDAFDPGWKATVDTAASPVLRANILFRAVAVPAGRHVVELRYRPASALAGALLSLGGLAATMGLLAGRGFDRPTAPL